MFTSADLILAHRPTVVEFALFMSLLIIYFVSYQLNKQIDHLQKTVAILSAKYLKQSTIEKRVRELDESIRELDESIREVSSTQEEQLKENVEYVEGEIETLHTRLRRLERTREATRKTYEHMDDSESDSD